MSPLALGRLASRYGRRSHDLLPPPASKTSSSREPSPLRNIHPRWLLPARKPSNSKFALFVLINITWVLFAHHYFFSTPRPRDGPRPKLDLSSIHEDQTHHIFRNPAHVPRSRRPVSIKAYDAMSDACVEQWVAGGYWGPDCSGTDLSEGLKVDGIWAWVNGSDPAQAAAREFYRPSGDVKVDAKHRYTERNELLYSMRSALSSLGADTLQRMHVLASAFPVTQVTGNDLMVGQVPAWLDKNESLSKDGNVALHHDSAVFRLMEGQDTDQAKWRASALPSFNSLSIESQFHNLDNTMSDQLVYYCDDFFTLRPLAVSDYTTPLYGPVIKTFSRLTSMYLPSKNPIWRFINPVGEEMGIKHAGWVLGQRFSTRPYYYITHHPRTLWLPLLREAAQTFPDAFSETALSRFRAEIDVPVPIQTVFLASWYVVERHREALLWSWTVAKWGGQEGIINPARKEQMWSELADDGTTEPGSRIRARVPIRAPAEDVETFGKANVDIPTSTEYSFSSKDGYAIAYLNSLWFWDRPKHGYPDLTKGLIEHQDVGADRKMDERYTQDPNFKPANMCSMSYYYCFGSKSSTRSASDFFKRLAFERPSCGDCIITALIGASGIAGIEKFLPSSSDVPLPQNSSSADRTLPHLPLTPEWQSTDFSLASAIPPDSGMELRTWCTRLIQRYSYVLGSTNSDFYQMKRADKTAAEFSKIKSLVAKDFEEHHIDRTPGYEGHVSWWRRVESSASELKERWRHAMGDRQFGRGGGGPLAFLCLNDDVKETGGKRRELEESLGRFFREMWPARMSFERDAEA